MKTYTKIIILLFFLLVGGLVVSGSYIDVRDRVISGVNRLLVGDGIELNSTGLFNNNSRITNKAYDVVVCSYDGTNPEVYSQCDVVCDDGDCSHKLNETDGKNIFFKEGEYQIHGNITLYNYTRWEGSTNTIINFTGIYRNVNRYPIIAYKGMTIKNIIFNNSLIDQPSSIYGFIKINKSDDIKSVISENYFYSIGLRIGSEVTGNHIDIHNTIVENNYFYKSIAPIQLVKVKNVVVTGNTLIDSIDSSISVNHCGENHIITNNIINNTNTGGGIEITQDGVCGLINNIMISNNIIMGSSDYDGLIAERALGSNSIISNNIIYMVPDTDDARGIVIRYDGTIVDGNRIYNVGREGIHLVSDTKPIKNVMITNNLFTNTRGNSGNINIQASNFNISNLIISNNIMSNTTSSNGLVFGISASKEISNSSITGNLIEANSTCIRSNVAGDGNLVNNYFANNLCVKKVTTNIDGDNYYDNMEYTTVGSCSTTNIFNDRTIINSSGGTYSRCSCIDGSWRCNEIN